MKRNNPWVSISDLLSSALLIILLMFVLSSILPKYTEEAQRLEMMEQIDANLKDYQEKGQVYVHVDTGVLEFTSVTFPSGSAMLTAEAIKAVEDFSKELRDYMISHPQMEILVEGHTDPAFVGAVINRGGYFADNIQLSTLRAANVRSLIVKSLGDEYKNRIGVAGYGETRLKNVENPLSPENRRIEIRILWNGKDK